jgi:PEP-CTERM motif
VFWEGILVKSIAFGALRVFAPLVLVVAIIQPGSAGVVVDDDFDHYLDQADFETTWVPVVSGPPASGDLSSLRSTSAPYSVHGGGTTVNGQARNRREFGATDPLSVSTELMWSFDFYDADGQAQPQRNYANLQSSTTPTSTNELIAMGTNNNQFAASSGGQYYMARILGYDPGIGPDPDGGPTESFGGSGAFFKLNDFGVGKRSTGWHNLKVILSTDDGLSTDYAFYVDSALAERVSNVGTVSTIRQYSNIVLGSGLSNANTEVFFDNVHLESLAVPEPASLALLAIGGAVSFVWHRCEFRPRRRVGGKRR